MALETNELYNSNTQGDQIRIFPEQNGVAPKDFAAVSGGALLLAGTPVVIHTTSLLWGVYDQGATAGQGIVGGILMDDTEINDSGVSDTETLANVMILGKLHRDDINTAAIRALLTGSPSEAQLDVALQAPTMRQKGLIVEGLAGVQ
jgi:hypothetical protein